MPHFNKTEVLFCNGKGHVPAAVSSVSTTHMLGLIPKFDTFVSISKLSCPKALMKCNESQSNGLSKIVTCNYRIFDSNDMP